MELRKYLTLFSLTICFLFGLASAARACPACWAGYGKGDERFNKPLADVRIAYETDGRDAIPYLREVLQTSTDPLVIKRTAGYIVELNDTGSLPILEDWVSMLVKRVAFGAFGFGTYEFRCRLAVAHALVNFGISEHMADKIWGKYDRLPLNRKTEVPYILNALQDPKLTERMTQIIDREENHQLMVEALDVLGIGAGPETLPFLRAKVEQWGNPDAGSTDNPDPQAPVIHYGALRIKAEKTIRAIEDRGKVSALSR